MLWKTSNVGPRHGRRASHELHHPSARNGLHEWLNRFTSAMARQAGLGVVDTTDVTLAHPPPLKTDVPEAKVTEGDLYHDYSSSVLLPPMCQRVCAACDPGGVRSRLARAQPLSLP